MALPSLLEKLPLLQACLSPAGAECSLLLVQHPGTLCHDLCHPGLIGSESSVLAGRAWVLFISVSLEPGWQMILPGDSQTVPKLCREEPRKGGGGLGDCGCDSAHPSSLIKAPPSSPTHPSPHPTLSSQERTELLMEEGECISSVRGTWSVMSKRRIFQQNRESLCPKHSNFILLGQNHIRHLGMNFLSDSKLCPSILWLS